MQITQGLNRAAAVNPRGTATIFRDRRRTWAETVERIGRIAGGFARLGVGKGDRVAILALNSDRYLEAMFALPALGAIIVPLNTRLAPAEIAFILQDSGATALLLDDTFAGLPGQLKDLAAVTSLVHIGEAPTPPGMIAYESLLAEVPESFGQAGDDDVAGIFYTGGTTGRSKGVMLTHRNLVAAAVLVVVRHVEFVGVLHGRHDAALRDLGRNQRANHRAVAQAVDLPDHVGRQGVDVDMLGRPLHEVVAVALFDPAHEAVDDGAVGGIVEPADRGGKASRGGDLRSGRGVSVGPFRKAVHEALLGRSCA